MAYVENADMEERKVLEQEFHNQRERDQQNLSDEEFLAKYPNKRFYSITKRSKDFLSSCLQKELAGKSVLDYCCGKGGSSMKFAKMGAMVWGIDISDESIATAKRNCKEKGLEDRVTFAVMDAEMMDFEDNKFDIIICSGVLHHLDLENAYPELARVLNADGMVIAQEALGYNPLINAYRRRTPQLRTAWEIDHILKLKDLKRAKNYFSLVDVNYFHLADIGALLFYKSKLFQPILKILGVVDSILLRVPFLQLMAWQMIFTLRYPKKGSG